MQDRPKSPRQLRKEREERNERPPVEEALTLQRAKQWIGWSARANRPRYSHE